MRVIDQSCETVNMATRMMSAIADGLDQLRFEPTEKRVWATVDGNPIVNTTRAVLIWEPRRFIPAYAVPVEDVTAQLQLSARESATGAAGAGYSLPGREGPPVLTPRDPFQMHTADGESMDLVTATARREAVGFRLSDPDLSGYVVLDFDGLDEWYEEDEPLVKHPRSPFTRIDLRQSSRNVRIELDATVLAETTSAMLVFETGLPVRYYLPRADVRVGLIPSQTRSACAYKGVASYWSAEVGDTLIEDLAWTYQAPLREVTDLVDLICFFDEKSDLILDGVARERPVTPWS